MKYYCNPINVPYRYQFNMDPRSGGKLQIDREAHRLPQALPLYDNAPDARVCGDYVYFCASKKGENCNYYRTKDIMKRKQSMAYIYHAHQRKSLV